MNSQILIDAIVRQTTVLIARLSTADGVRSPLAHVAGEVFVGIVKELESQGVGKKVIADMFGLALRSYRQKVQRLGESATTRGVTLWTAIHGFIASRDSVSRSELLERFKHDEESSVKGIINDLVETGLVIRSGRAETTSYTAASEEDLQDLGNLPQSNPAHSLAALVWLQVYREGPLKREPLAKLVPLEAAELEDVLAALLSDGRIRSETRGGETYFATDHCLIPLGESAGWEAAVIDHHRTVLNALASKIQSGTLSAERRDEVGGTTLSFDLWPGHPKEAEVRRLLATTRGQVIPLWEQVTEHNRTHSGEDSYQVHFYCGQYVLEEQEP